MPAAFSGSPTLLVDGRDPFPAAGPVGPSCRLYRTPEGPTNAPTVDQLVAALRGRVYPSPDRAGSS